MYLSEALSGHYPFELSPRLHSLRSLSQGLLRMYLSEALNLYHLFSPRLHSLAGCGKVGLGAVRLKFNMPLLLTTACCD